MYFYIFSISDNIAVFLFVVGMLVTASVLDREKESQYEVQVVVTDGEIETVTPVLVTVTDVNDNAPLFMEKVYRVTVPDRLPSGLPNSIFRVSFLYSTHIFFLLRSFTQFYNLF